MQLITIPNITIELVENEGLLSFCKITPNAGYVLHDKVLDTRETDENGYPSMALGYTSVESTCFTNYDFTATSEVDGHTAYGAREFFAVPEV